MQLASQQLLVDGSEHAAVARQNMHVLHLQVGVVVADQPVHQYVVKAAHQHHAVDVLLGVLCDYLVDLVVEHQSAAEFFNESDVYTYHTQLADVEFQEAGGGIW